MKRPFKIPLFYPILSDIFINKSILLYRMVKTLRKKISVTIEEELIEQLRREAKDKNLSLSRLIENKLKEVK